MKKLYVDAFQEEQDSDIDYDYDGEYDEEEDGVFFETSDENKATEEEFLSFLFCFSFFFFSSFHFFSWRFRHEGCQ